MKKRAGCFCTFIVGLLLSGCYQVHSDDDLRSVPVTNNPRIVPSSQNGGSPFVPGIGTGRSS